MKGSAEGGLVYMFSLDRLKASRVLDPDRKGSEGKKDGGSHVSLCR